MGGSDNKKFRNFATETNYGDNVDNIFPPLINTQFDLSKW
jgi:hypothetical protein